MKEILRPRLEYIDGMRAMAIFMVIYAHILYISYGNAHIMSIHSVFINFFMHIFFFISGFFVFKNKSLSIRDIIRMLIKRFVQLIIPPFIFGTLYAYVTGRGIYDMLLIDSHSGYWYTLVMFVFIFIYSFVAWLDSTSRLLLLIFVTICVYGISIYSQHHYSDNVWCSLFSVQRWYYIVFFIEGMLLKRFYQLFERYASGKLLPSISIISFFFFVIFQERLYDLVGGFPLAGSVIQISYSTISLLTIWLFFYKYSSFFERQNFISKCFSNIGKRTLDIYMIHFFFIPANLKSVAAIIMNNDSYVVDFMITSPIALILMFVSYFIGSIIRLSKPLSYYTLGGSEK